MHILSKDGIFTRSWSAMLQGLRYHGVSAAIVLGVATVCQITIARQTPSVLITPDSIDYINAAHRLMSGNLAPHLTRTPGYPLFFAIIFWVTHSDNLHAVVLAQSALLIVSALEIYAFCYVLTSHRWVGVVAAVLVGGNLYLGNWSRTILSESLTVWLLVSVMLCFALYIRRPSRVMLCFIMILLAVCVFTRPQAIYLPALLLVLFWVYTLRRHAARPYLATLGVACIYGLVLCYMGAFWLTYGTFSVSRVSNVDMLGTMLVLYQDDHMPLAGADPSYDHFRADLVAFERHNPPDPWAFVLSHPQYDTHAGRYYGTFAFQVLRAHPGYVLHMDYEWFLSTTSWNQAPSVLAPINAAPAWWLQLSTITSLVYRGLPLLGIAAVAAVWRRLASGQVLIFAALVLLVLGHVSMAVIADYTDFDRLRMPADWAMITATILGITALTGKWHSTW